MIFTLRRATDADGLALAREHARVVAPRRGRVRWDFDPSAYEPRALAGAANAWRARVAQEYHSLALVTQLASQLHLLCPPLDWSGAFARLIADEVRHTEFAARLVELLGGAPAEISAGELHLPVVARSGVDHAGRRPDVPSLRAHVRGVVVAALCIGETLSGRMFRRCLRAATVPVARDVVRTIVDDETFHAELGWEVGALLMRDGGTREHRHERDALAGQLPEVFAHYRRLCGADRGEAWAREAPEAPPAPNFGTLTEQGYARAFYEGMTKDVVPGLVAIGLPEAADAWSETRV